MTFEELSKSSYFESVALRVSDMVAPGIHHMMIRYMSPNERNLTIRVNRQPWSTIRTTRQAYTAHYALKNETVVDIVSSVVSLLYSMLEIVLQLLQRVQARTDGCVSQEDA